MLEHITQRQR